MQQVRTTQEQLIQSEALRRSVNSSRSVAHELNNPLTAVIGYSELLQSMSIRRKMRENLDGIGRAPTAVTRLAIRNLVACGVQGHDVLLWRSGSAWRARPGRC